MDDCIFCKIVDKKISAERVYEDPRMIIIRDIEPKARLHYLAIPKRHYASLREMDVVDVGVLGHVFDAIARQAKALGLSNGYRLIVNQGKDAGQTVNHMHIHILGGEELPFP